jgi:bloom syndrome protein
MGLGQDVASLIKAMKLLQIPHVVDSICGGELAGDFGDGPSGGWMRLVERCARVQADKTRGN